MPLLYRYNALLDLIEYAKNHQVDDDDMENDPDVYQQAVDDNIKKVSSLKDEPTAYFSHEAYLVRCASKK
jgi:hypothetical protein